MKNFKKIFFIIKTIVFKDFIEEIKSKEIFISIISYSTLVLVVVATTSSVNKSTEFFSTIFWISISFSIILGINKSMSKEFENRGIELLLAAPIDKELIIISKFISNFIFINLSSLFILLFNTVILNYDLFEIQFLLLVLIVNLGFSIIGTITFLLFSKVRGKEILSPMLFIPLISPLLMGGSILTNQIIQNDIKNISWFGLIIAYDLLFFLVGLLISNIIFEE
ncbi:MAG: heme exporter protein CcmB [Chloroflexota bacterium]|jgi:heme exporter protein B|nr:heme exporter protein CcmB [Chloroflexota bacterium]MED5237645.1 heme exporter protein CcmB [Chloroflexota bacterium]MED5255481.1 heme exporter protein CcmB [Chloroflexota bacterium]|tara:strand:+ start:2649 stop:3320 length:672 start_codon:yes stop_codon:yes gene_type:complete